MSWEQKEKERLREIEEERQRLIKMTDGEAESLPVPDRYQRIRYLREIEAAKWLEEERRKIPAASQDFKPLKKRYGSKIIYNKFSD
jgi:hypothetical protein